MFFLRGWVMAGRDRKYTPRVRSRRPLGEPRSSNSPPAKPLPAPKQKEGLWYIPSPLAQRLHEKSALGTTTSDGGILLTEAEVLFCHWYRHVPLDIDQASWFEQRVREDPRSAMKIIGMDVLRNGGELVVPCVHLNERFPSLHSATWALRWERHQSWKKHAGFSQVRLQHTNDLLDWDELLGWVDDVHSSGHVAELCVVDDEFDATIYHLERTHPQGGQRLHSDLTAREQTALKDLCETAVQMNDGFFLSTTIDWPLPSIGVEHFSGRYLRKEEHTYLTGRTSTPIESLYAQLLDAGLLLRPGFKFGCRWRVYERNIELEHAPWLVQPVEDAPTNWEEVCLAVRLAEGVNKRWLCAIQHGDEFSYLNIKRRA